MVGGMRRNKLVVTLYFKIILLSMKIAIPPIVGPVWFFVSNYLSVDKDSLQIINSNVILSLLKGY